MYAGTTEHARAMIIGNDASGRARWKVMWRVDGRTITKDFGPDYSEALALYTKVKSAGRKLATLCCKNMPFAPPEKLRPRRVKGYRRSARGKREYVEGYVVPLRKMNAQGVWWCPYCIQLRRFVKRKGFRYKGVYVPEPGYHCPMCNISHRDGAVRKWNPVAQKMYANPERRRARRRRR